jgi:hypothetical protein
MSLRLSRLPVFGVVMAAGLVGILGFGVLVGLSLVQELADREEHARIETQN